MRLWDFDSPIKLTLVAIHLNTTGWDLLSTKKPTIQLLLLERQRGNRVLSQAHDKLRIPVQSHIS